MTTSEARSAALDLFERDYGKWVLGNCHAKTAEAAVDLLADRFGSGAGREVPGAYEMRINGEGLTINPAYAAGKKKPDTAVVPWLEVLDRLGWVPAVVPPNGVPEVAKATAGRKRGKAAAANDDAAEERRETAQEEQQAVNGDVGGTTRMFPVEFSGVGIGETSARIGVTLSRDDMDIDVADDLLCGRRIKGKIEAHKKGGDSEGQGYLKNVRPSITAVFECKSFRTGPSKIGASLNFALNDLTGDDLRHFANRNGNLYIESAEELKTDD